MRPWKLWLSKSHESTHLNSTTIGLDIDCTCSDTRHVSQTTHLNHLRVTFKSTYFIFASGSPFPDPPFRIPLSGVGELYGRAKQCWVLGNRFGGATRHSFVIPVVIPQFHLVGMTTLWRVAALCTCPISISVMISTRISIRTSIVMINRVMTIITIIIVIVIIIIIISSSSSIIIVISFIVIGISCMCVMMCVIVRSCIIVIIIICYDY